MRTVGIEEELLVVGADDHHPRPMGGEVVTAAAGGARGGQFESEFKREQAELGTTPSESIAELATQLHELRSALMAAARAVSAEVLAIASSPFKVRPTPSEGARYAAMTRRFGLLARQQLTCGQHVHVSVDSREEGVQVLDRVRPWLPVLTALSGNSPFWQGEDSGYASYRHIMWGLWPTAGPSEIFGSEDGYDRVIAQLLASEAALDLGMMYFDARLSARYPTVEVRVPDVCTSVDDAVLMAAVARGLVETAAREARAGVAPVLVSAKLLQVAGWQAAREGMSGELYDPVAVESVPARRLMSRLLDHIGEALTDCGDWDRVRHGVARIQKVGTGSEEQRRIFARSRGDFGDVLADAAVRTVTPPAS